jgi:hypothetical protein
MWDKDMLRERQSSHRESRRALTRGSKREEESRRPMAEVRVILAGLWVAVMLTDLLGDVLRIFAGDFKVVSTSACARVGLTAHPVHTHDQRCDCAEDLQIPFAIERCRGLRG